jgi:cytochrome b6-f complex iron-sulfur subunit
VAATTDLPDGAVSSCDLGEVTGFVQRAGGRLSAVSGICTHQGCRLRLDAAQHRLRCPCHSTSFALTGELVSHALAVPPSPLPQLAVRETGGDIEVYAPAPDPAEPAPTSDRGTRPR